jgi:predicted SAM-dependent methyltransferase
MQYNFLQRLYWKFERIKNKLKCYPIFKKYYCCVCNNTVGGFIPFRGGYKNQSSFIKSIELIGSNLDLYKCPRCHANDRERHLFLYFKANNFEKIFYKKNILHFAPEKHLSELIKTYNPNIYIQCDLQPKSKNIQKINIENIPHKNSTFELIIANHVLEHVYNDSLAIKEIYRVLKPEGFAVLQVPFSKKLPSTFSDAKINTDYLKNFFYGQEDHVRIYGQDFIERIRNNGFQDFTQLHDLKLANFNAKFYGVNNQELFLLFKK